MVAQLTPSGSIYNSGGLPYHTAQLPPPLGSQWYLFIEDAWHVGTSESLSGTGIVVASGLLWLLV